MESGVFLPRVGGIDHKGLIIIPDHPDVEENNQKLSSTTRYVKG
jgi:hypothetical protein